MKPLSDRSVPLSQLIAVREIAKNFESGLLTPQETMIALERISPHFAGCFTNVATAAATIELIDALVTARSPGAARQSRSERMRFKAAECLALADNARHARTKETYRNLAACYEQLALQAETMEKQKLAMIEQRTRTRL